MSCCGQKRQALKSAEAQTTTVNPSQPATRDSVPEPSGATDKTRLRYLQEKPIVVRGFISRKRYFFSGDRPLNIVETKDVESLMKTGVFRPA